MTGPKWIAASRLARRPHVDVRREREGRRHDPDDGVRFAVDAKPSDREIRQIVKMSAPEAVADDRGTWPAFTALVRREPAALRGIRGEHVEEAARDLGQPGTQRQVAHPHRCRTHTELGHRAKAVRLISDVLEVRIRELSTAPACLVHLVELYDLIRTRVRQWTQHDTIHHAVHRGAGADRDAQCQNGDEREPRRAAQKPDRKANVAQQGGHTLFDEIRLAGVPPAATMRFNHGAGRLPGRLSSPAATESGTPAGRPGSIP